MEFAKLSSPSLKDLFVQQLQGMILSGALPVGTQLPPERGPPPAGHLRSGLPAEGKPEHPHCHHAVQGRRAGAG